MNTQTQRRWGIVALSVAMFLVAVLFGSKGSMYSAIWLIVGYYGYKGDLIIIKQWMKWLIFINIGALALVLLFVSDEVTTHIHNSWGKLDLAFGVLIMLIPKIGLYFYVNNQLLTTATQKLNISITTDFNDDEVWEEISQEFNSTRRNEGLWARCFAQANGDELKAKAQYLNVRYVQLRKSSGTQHTNNSAKDNKDETPKVEWKAILIGVLTLWGISWFLTNLPKFLR